MENYVFPAHIRKGVEPFIQTVEQHGLNTADYTAAVLRGVRLEKTGYLLGCVHDCGKLTSEFSDYITRASRGEAVQRGTVNHTFAAVKLLLSRFHTGEDIYRKVAAELFAYSVGSHHGLFDCIGPDRKNGFTHRLSKESVLFEEASSNMFKLFCSPHDLKRWFSEASVELKPILTRLVEISARDQSGAELSFYFGCLSRLMLSALIDGDRRDTAEFMSAKKLPVEKHMTPDLWRRYLLRVESKLEELTNDMAARCSRSGAVIIQARTTLSKQCRECAKRPGGIYRLNLPTGAGKTLGSLRYALAHAAEHGKERIIFVSPLLSILEQNAAVIRQYLADDEIILEHHSNVVRTESEPEALALNELLTDTWVSPVIITTLVQLLNTLFDGRTTAVRRFHSLCCSVIVVDEVQTLPPKLLSLFQLAISFLSEICKSTVLLCSATQPADEYTPHPFFRPPESLIPYDPAIWQAFQRTELKESVRCSLGEIPKTAENILKRYDSLLIICNTKTEAAILHRDLQSSDHSCFHLSAAMCAAHRTETVEALRKSLNPENNKNKKTVCVSTQVIEAGVDISFACVIRLTAGMDNIIQAAGRCNRNGESETPAPVFILNCTDENLSYLSEIALAKNATEELLAEYRKDAGAFDSDLSSESAIQYYYKRLYDGMEVNAQDYPAGEHGTLFDLLANNTKYATENSESYGQYFLCQAFKTAGKLFSVFGAETETLLVPYGEGAEIIQSIQKIGDRRDPEALQELRILTERAKPFSVSVFPYQLERLEKVGAIDRICCDGIICLQPDCFGDIPYSKETGLII